jgi:pectate lyase
MRMLKSACPVLLLLLAGCGGGSGGGADADAGDDPVEEATDDASADPAVDPSTDPPVDVSPDGPVAGGYEGFGAVTRGHDDCPDTPAEVHVTSLDDDGAGTLREALGEGCRHVVFDVGGTIVLESDLNIRWSYVTVDGATAPEPGITIEQPGDIGTTIEARSSTGAAHDIVINNLRMDGQAGSHVNVGDIWGLDGESAPVYRVVIDHVTGIASTDGVFDFWEDVKDVTISWCLIVDTITALHLSSDDHSRTRERISIHHNVFARNNERQIRIRHASTDVDLVNNVVYGWGWFEGGGYGLGIQLDPGETNPSLNVIANVFHFVADLHGTEDGAVVFVRGADEGQVYFEGNVVPSVEGDLVSSGPRIDIPVHAAVTTLPAADLGTDVVPHVGTHHPTADEQALLAEIEAAL